MEISLLSIVAVIGRITSKRQGNLCTATNDSVVFLLGKMIPDFRYAVRQPVKTIPPNCRHVNDSADVFLNGLLKHVCQNRLFVDIWQTAISGTAAVINSHISVENTYIVINLLAAGERINLCCLAKISPAVNYLYIVTECFVLVM